MHIEWLKNKRIEAFYNFSSLKVYTLLNYFYNDVIILFLILLHNTPGNIITFIPTFSL